MRSTYESVRLDKHNSSFTTEVTEAALPKNGGHREFSIKKVCSSLYFLCVLCGERARSVRDGIMSHARTRGQAHDAVVQVDRDSMVAEELVPRFRRDGCRAGCSVRAGSTPRADSCGTGSSETPDRTRSPPRAHVRITTNHGGGRRYFLYPFRLTRISRRTLIPPRPFQRSSLLFQKTKDKRQERHYEN